MSSEPPRPQRSFLDRQHLGALRDHERYLVALLAGYDGPYRDEWERELERVREQIAQREGRAPR